MRQAFNNVSVLNTVSENGANLKGISLGYDFCAEHEFGTQGIRSRLGVTQNFNFEDFIKDYAAADKAAPTSVEDFKIAKDAKIILLTAEVSATDLKKGYSSEKSVEEDYKRLYKEKLNKKRVPAVKAKIAILLTDSWHIQYLAERIEESQKQLAEKLKRGGPQHIELSVEEFFCLNQNYFKCNESSIRTQAFVYAAKDIEVSVKLPTYWKEYTESHWAADDFMFITSGEANCAVLRDVYNAILEGSAYYGVSTESNPFSRSSPCIMVSELTQEEKDKIAQDWLAIRQFSKEILETGIHAKLKASGKGYYALSPSKQSDGSVKFWLNPQNQQKYNHGWFTLDQLSDWAENKGPIIKE